MQNTLPLRPSLKEDLVAAIRTLIFEGQLHPNKHINEVHLARHFAVSRTPLREALSALQAEGAVAHKARRGFFVHELNAEEVREIYPIRSYLDPEALRLSGIPEKARLARLYGMAKRFPTVTDVDEAIKLDEDWHRLLWAHCPNRVLTELIEQFMRRTKRYELASMRDARTLNTTSKYKINILDALSKNNVETACNHLRLSLKNGAKPVFAWLEGRNNGE